MDDKADPKNASLSQKYNEFYSIIPRALKKALFDLRDSVPVLSWELLELFFKTFILGDMIV